MQTLTALKDRTQLAIDYLVKQRNLKPTEIGRRIGSKPDTIRKYRSKSATPSVRFLQRFCTAFEVDFLWITKGIGKPFPGEDVEFSNGSDVPETVSPETDTLSEDAPEKKSGAVWADSEICFQKLALMAGIKIDSEWILKLSDAIGVASWKISLSIHYQRIDRELIAAAENRGYKKEDWLVAIQSGKDMPQAETDEMDTPHLLKIAEEVLRSNTIHSTSLAMNIISMKAIFDGRDAGPVSGLRAVNLPKTYDLQLLKLASQEN